MLATNLLTLYVDGLLELEGASCSQTACHLSIHLSTKVLAIKVKVSPSQTSGLALWSPHVWSSIAKFAWRCATSVTDSSWMWPYFNDIDWQAPVVAPYDALMFNGTYANGTWISAASNFMSSSDHIYCRGYLGRSILILKLFVFWSWIFCIYTSWVWSILRKQTIYMNLYSITLLLEWLGFHYVWALAKFVLNATFTSYCYLVRTAALSKLPLGIPNLVVVVNECDSSRCL